MLGLASGYIVQKMGAIAFCPPTFVRSAWIRVQQEAPHPPRVGELVEYFSTTWVSGSYQIRQWNHYKTDGPRTNNHVEGLHSRLKKLVGKAHPIIYELVEVINHASAAVSGRCFTAPRRRKVRARGRDRKIQTLFQRLELETITLDDYLEGITGL